MKKKFNWRAGLKHFAQFWGVVLLELVIEAGYVALMMFGGSDELGAIIAGLFTVLMNAVWYGLLVRVESKVINGILLFSHYLSSFFEIFGGIGLACSVLVSIIRNFTEPYYYSSYGGGGASSVLAGLFCIAACVANFLIRRNLMEDLVVHDQGVEEEKEPMDDSPIFHEPGQYGTKTLTTPVMAANSRRNIAADDLTETSGSLPSAESEPEPETVPTPEPEPEPFLCGMPFIWQEQREQKAAELAAATGIENGPELLKVLLIMEEEKDMELEQERSKRWLALKHEKRKLRHARVAAILCAVLLCACVGLGTAGIATGYVELGNHHDTEWNTMRNTQINIRKEITKTTYEKVYVGMSWRKFCIITAMPNAMITHSFNKVYVVGESGTCFFYFKDGKLASKERK